MHGDTSGSGNTTRRRRHRVRRTSSGALAASSIAAVSLAVFLSLAGASPSATSSSTAGEPLETLVGARLVVGMQGTTPSAALLDRIRRGRVGAVILMGANVRSAPQVRALTSALRAAADRGGRKLLIMTDQEGGLVRRFRWAPPAASAETLGTRTEGAIRSSGRATGAALRRLGVDVDLAPIADVPGVPDSFIAAMDRDYSTSPARAAKGVTAFAAGLLDGGAAPTLKHFPGLGLAATSTDDAAVRIGASEKALQPGFVPYRRAIAAGVVPLVMVSNAAYAAYGGRVAAWSPRVLSSLAGLGFTGVTITDALEPLARTHDVTLGEAALRAARAGVDLLLFVGSEQSTDAVYDQLLAAARDGRLPRSALRASAARIDELAATYAG
jgi:beta-N-acetylhexosaminidase